MTPHDLESILIGVSPIIAAMRRRIMQFGPTDLPVLLQGPTGVGKELVATALHAFSNRTGALVSVNSAAIPESMFEAEMFGYVKGAFSGASIDKAGFFAEANGGTLFLDEIGTMSLVVQPKLLRALDSRSYRPLGAKLDRYSDFRVVAATNEALEASVGLSRFRADLFHRLRVVVIDIPALSARPEDIPILARHFAAQLGAPHGPIEISDEVIEQLATRPWPGNVRELRYVVRCAAAVARSFRITRADLAAALSPLSATAALEMAADRERHELLDALRRHGWHVGHTARALQIHRVTLSRRIARLGIKLPARQALGGSGAPGADLEQVTSVEREPGDDRLPDKPGVAC